MEGRAGARRVYVSVGSLNCQSLSSGASDRPLFCDLAPLQSAHVGAGGEGSFPGLWVFDVNV